MDVSSPLPGTVFDGVEYGVDVDLQGTWETVSATWSAFEDEESGIANYSFCVGSEPGLDDLAACRDVGHRLWASTAVNMPTISHAVDTSAQELPGYYVTVMATNGAGLTSSAYSDGCIVDTLPPMNPHGDCVGTVCTTPSQVGESVPQ